MLARIKDFLMVEVGLMFIFDKTGKWPSMTRLHRALGWMIIPFVVSLAMLLLSESEAVSTIAAFLLLLSAVNIGWQIVSTAVWFLALTDRQQRDLRQMEQDWALKGRIIKYDRDGNVIEDSWKSEGANR